MKKIFAFMLVFLLGCLPAAAQIPAQESLQQVNASQVWPAKAAWIGQKAVFFRAKMHQNVSYLFLYESPLSSPSGSDQLFLGKSLANKSVIIKGLFQLNRPGKVEFFWCLASEDGKTAVWVKDNINTLLKDEPFALESEISREKQAIGRVAGLVNIEVWNNSNLVGAGELSGQAGHLQPLKVVEVRSAGPFSEKYTVILQKSDQTLIQWKVGLQSNTPVYNHDQFYDLFRKTFILSDPFSTHPDWSESVWEAVKARRILVGFDREMVLLSWGTPDNTTPAAKDGYIVWEYSDQCFLYFKNTTLAKIKVPDPKFTSRSGQPKSTRTDMKFLEVNEFTLK